MRDERFFLVTQLWTGALAGPNGADLMDPRFHAGGIERIRKLADAILKDLNADKQAPLDSIEVPPQVGPNRINFEEDDEDGPQTAPV